MMDLIAVMKRYELKYLLNAAQTAFLTERLKNRMALDQYGRTSVASLYYDTPDFRLIRASMEKPAFKEKIRLRSYGLATPRSAVYLELKRKAGGIVYKRRVQSTVAGADAFFTGGAALCDDGQIAREITYFRDYYGALSPACLIVCDREAYYEPGGDLRLTIDYNPRQRMERLSLTCSLEGRLLLPPGHTILEVKAQEAVPLWLAKILSEGQIYETGFSKYGEAFRQRLLSAGQTAAA